MKRLTKLGLSGQIIIALILGAIVGLVMNIYFSDVFTFADTYIFTPLGKIFLNLIQMVVVPLVFFSIGLGTVNLGDPKKLGRIGVKAMGFFLFTTTAALVLAISLALIFKPGTVAEFDISNLVYTPGEAPPMSESILNIIPTNPVKAFAEGNMIQIIVFSVILGFAMAMLGDRVKTVVHFFDEMNEIMMKLISLIMRLAPLGSFGLIASAIGKMGFEAMGAMLSYMFVVFLALAIHYFVIYSGIIKFFAKRSPLEFHKSYLPALSVAFSTSSSSAALPVAMDIAQNKLGVPKAISRFVQPLGATVNMDGTAIMQGVATVFIAQVMNVHLSLADLVTVVIMAVLASVGTASVPGVGMVMLAMVLQSVGLPVEGIALIIGIDRILDMTRTAVNSSCDAIAAMYIAESEKRREHRLAKKLNKTSDQKAYEAI